MNTEEKSIKTLRKLKKIFDKHNIEYWLDEGTLLGAVREKKLIEWDHDIDIGLWTTTISKILPLFDEIRNVGIEVCFHEWKKNIKLLGRGYEIDINPYHLKDDKATRIWYVHNKLGRIFDYLIWTSNLRNAKIRESDAPLFITKIIVRTSIILPDLMNKKISQILFKIYEKIGCKFVHMAVPSHFFINFKELGFYGIDFKVPKKTEEYLEYRYGKNWRIPKKDYIYYRDDGANIL